MAQRLGAREILSSDEIARYVARISHEITEREGGVAGLALVGIHTRGVPLAERIAKAIRDFAGEDVGGRRRRTRGVDPVGALDIGLYRDDVSGGVRPVMRPTHIPVNIQDMSIILVDDVLYTGRTIRAAMDALNDFGRPRDIQLAVLVDRGHRELPIRAEYVGKNVPTSFDEQVEVRLAEIDGVDEALILRREDE